MYPECSLPPHGSTTASPAAEKSSYAQASAARVTLSQDGQHLVFTVTDDGTGFHPATTPMGTGLQGIADRLAALDGTVGITSAPGHGTQITGRIRAIR
jgi:signal transduction histidine kinase